ncbi:ribosomal protein S16 [Kwoniella mangroviensis CBS 8886]|uniref:mitochondrial 37S ribosomal protein bS16m n=1 Tax=Kwoniella mangroviensis CBS 8507 TaxID=1296122 RepID=UPI00080D394C|nr:ribosomal protein S16 [Kwoniella mangroviensis CBS 8507]OCF66303.1 ribosomal protein S16 [Kwoniella mangroviensis CBS 8507]OCF73440.1 ribosomal protein S16 [Kwoniella mangroviensis CBS 8886]
MPVRIRLARHGYKKSPLYHIVAINSKRPREGKPLETLGIYDPIPRLRKGVVVPPQANVFGSGPEDTGLIKKEKEIKWNVDRINYWLGVGAEPTRSVVKLLERGGVLTTPHKWQHPWSPAPPPSSTPPSQPQQTISQ